MNGYKDFYSIKLMETAQAKDYPKCVQFAPQIIRKFPEHILIAGFLLLSFGGFHLLYHIPNISQDFGDF